MNSSKGNVAATAYERGQIEHQQIQPASLEWARRWREGDARCPRCTGTDFELVDFRAEGQMRYETLRCKAAACRASWKVEFREAALAVLEDNIGSEGIWIELVPEPRSVGLRSGQ